jgi:hypothetical protein
VMPSSMEGALEAATNLSSGLGIDLRTATLAVGKAIAGEAGSLKKFGVEISDMAAQAQGAGAVIDAVNAKFSGQAAAAIETYAGKLQQAENAWNDLKEALGRAVLGSKVVELGINTITGELDHMAVSADKAAPSVTAALAAMATGRPDGLILWAEAIADYADALGEAERMGRRAAGIKSPFEEFAKNSGRISATADDMRRMNDQTAKLEKSLDADAKAMAEFNQQVARLTGAKALKDAGEALKQLAAAGGPSGVLPSQLKGLADTFERAGEAARNMGLTERAREYELLAKTLNPIVQFQQKYNVTIGEFLTTNPSYIGAIQEQLSIFEKQPDAINIGLLAIRQYNEEWRGLARTIQQNKPHLELTEEQLRKLNEEAERAARQGLRDLASAFADLAQSAGISEHSVVAAVAKIIGAMSLGAEAGNQMSQGWKELTRDNGSLLAGFTQLAAGAVAAAAAIDQATQSGNRAQSSLSGAAAGAKAGSAFGGVGALVGGAIGFIVGFERASKRAREETARMNREFDEARQKLLGMIVPTGNLAEAMRMMGLNLQSAFQGSTQDRLKTINNLLAEFPKRLADTNAQFAPLLSQFAALGMGLPPALAASLQHLIDIGVISQENATILGNLTEVGTVDWRKMQEVAEKYGISLADLGDKFQGNKIHSTAEEIINDFDLLIRGGADVGGALFGARDEMSHLVNDALKAGKEIPENMRPWIEELARSGNLFTENRIKANEFAQQMIGMGESLPAGLAPILQHFIETGDLIDANTGKVLTFDELMSMFGAGASDDMKKVIEKLILMGEGLGDNQGEIKDLSELKFEEPIRTQFEKITEALLKVVENLGKIASTIAGIPTEKTIHIGWQVDEPPTIPGFGDGHFDWGGGQAAGGEGVVTRPTVFVAGEAGPERYWFSGAGKASAAPPAGAGAGMSSGGGADLTELGDLIRDMPRAIALAVSDAMLIAGGRR